MVEFISRVMDRPWLAVSKLIKMLSFNEGDLGFMKKIRYKVSEQIIMTDVREKFKGKNDILDIEDFIMRNTQGMKIESLYEKTTNDIVSFWKIWASENLNVLSVLNLGISIVK